MARKKAQAEHENHERWLVSYADFITLLFAFFVVMFASSQTDKAKAQQVSQSVQQALGNGGIKAVVHEILGGTVDDKGKGNAQMRGPGGAQKQTKDPTRAAELLPSMQFLSKALDEDIREGKIQVHLEPRGLIVSLRQASFFPSGGDTIAPDSYPTIDKIVEVLQKLPNNVRLEGHTDGIPIHTDRFPSNWELSSARAIAMLHLLNNRYDLPINKFAVAGYADTIPIDSNDTEEGRRHNRRVDVVVLNQNALVSEPLAAGATVDSEKGAQTLAKPGAPGSAAAPAKPGAPGSAAAPGSTAAPVVKATPAASGAVPAPGATIPAPAAAPASSGSAAAPKGPQIAK